MKRSNKFNQLSKIGLNNLIICLSLVGLLSSVNALTNTTNIKTIQDISKYPVSIDKVSKSRDGNLDDSIAITDGIGTLLLGDINLNNKNYSNKSYNKVLSDNKNNIVDNNKSLDALITNNIVILDTNTLNKINNDNVLVDITNSGGSISYTCSNTNDFLDNNKCYTSSTSLCSNGTYDTTTKLCSNSNDILVN